MTSEQKRIFGTQLKRMRKSKNIPQWKLGELLGCSQGYVHLYEKGEHSPKRSQMIKIIRLLGLSRNDQQILSRLWLRCHSELMAKYMERAEHARTFNPKHQVRK